MSDGPKQRNRGPLSREEETKILSLLHTHSDEEISKIVNKTPERVKLVRDAASTIKANREYESVIIALHSKFFWDETLKQLLPEEVKYFENYWASLVNQFSANSVVATDELMMRDLILLDILLNRCNKSRKACAEELQEIESEIIKVKLETEDDQTARVTLLIPLQDRANAIRTAAKSLNEESKNIQEKKDKKYEQLKATREMRLDKAERAGQDFYQLVKHLDSPEMRAEQGRINSLYQVAVEIARLEFQQLHKYSNNTHDNPILTPEQQEKENESS